jgi:hypothetical protein
VSKLAALNCPPELHGGPDYWDCPDHFRFTHRINLNLKPAAFAGDIGLSRRS